MSQGLFSKLFYGSSKDDRRFWLPDRQYKHCTGCDAPFSAFRRRHHCRLCGKIYCYKCSSNVLEVHHKKSRVCDSCYTRSSQSHLREAYEKDEVKSPPLNPLEDLREESYTPRRRTDENKEVDISEEESIVPNPVSSAISPRGTEKEEDDSGEEWNWIWKEFDDNFMNTFDSDEEGSGVESSAPQPDGNSETSSTLDDPADTSDVDIQSSIEPARRHFFSSFIRNSSTSLKASPYTVKSPSPAVDTPSKKFVNVLKSSFNLHEFVNSPRKKKQTVSLVEKHEPEVEEKEWRQNKERDWDEIVHRALCDSFARNPTVALEREVLEYLIQLSYPSISSFIYKPHFGNSMDPTRYIKVKRIPYGNLRDDSFVLDGVIFRQNVVHKAMRSMIMQPRILLIAAKIEFLRGFQYTTLEEALLQESDYLRLVVAKISSLSPDLVIVQHSVSRIAQQYFREKGISLICNVGKAVRMRRLERFLGASLIFDYDTINHNMGSFVGTCKTFKIVDYPTVKGLISYVYLEGCPWKFGSTVCLLDQDQAYLNRCKQVMNAIITEGYSVYRERDFLSDIHALPRLENCARSAFNELHIDYQVESKYPIVRPAKKATKSYMESSLAYTTATPMATTFNPNHMIRLLKENIQVPALPPSYFPYTHALCSVDGNHSTLCLPFETHIVDYYALSDLTLGCYLNTLCFDTTKTCLIDHCSKRLWKHQRSFIHGQGRVNVEIIEVDDDDPTTQNDPHTIYTRSTCKKCGTIVPPSPLSPSALNLSFSKFLFLIFHAETLPDPLFIIGRRCYHSNFRDHVRYFQKGKLVAVWEYIHMPTNTIHLPPPHLDFSPYSPNDWDEEFIHLRNKATEAFAWIAEEIQGIVDVDIDTITAHLSDLSSGRADFFEALVSKSSGPSELHCSALHLLWHALYTTVSVWIDISQQLSHIPKEKKNMVDNTTYIPSSGDTNHPVTLRVSSAEVPHLDGSVSEATHPSLGSISLCEMENRLGTVETEGESEIRSGEGLKVGDIPRPKSPDRLNGELEEKRGKSARNRRPEGLLSYLYATVIADPNESKAKRIAGVLGHMVAGPVGHNGRIVLLNVESIGSLIAYSLASVEYYTAFVDHYNTFFPLHMVPSDIVDQKDSYLALMLTPHRSHIRIRMPDAAASLLCQVYFAPQFAAMRMLYCNGSENRFIESLSWCQDWLADGGKSGSSWSKTKDERFLIKEISRIELLSFLEFAPLYFEYLVNAFEQDQPTLLTKIFGLYAVNWRRGNGKTEKRVVIVMENLMCGKQATKIFDLKGSLRNRRADVDEEELESNEHKLHAAKVLLDVNYLENLFIEPMIVDGQDKALLSAAVWNDTIFLASMGVMDYSLLVIVEEKNQAIHVGIIDFLRKYTWDKQVERFIKTSGLLGGGRGNTPTVISPNQYKTRFRDAIWTYFPTALDDIL